MPLTFIRTPHGSRCIDRRVGTAGEYVLTLPTRSEPHGAWWTFNPQRGWVPVPSTSPALQAALAAAAPLFPAV